MTRRPSEAPPPGGWTPYDTVRYPSYSHTRSHVDRLATQAILYGLTPAPVESCRVLELGCGNASNLVPMAYGLPGSRFVGVDLAGGPLAHGRQMVDDLGLKNVELHQANLTALDGSFGEFDYIVAHGLYSWVPPDVRAKLLSLCAALLAPEGVVFVSYLTYPGAHGRQMLRDAMLYHLGELADAPVVQREAREFARLLASAPTTSDPFQVLLRAEADRFVRGNPDHLFHDDLAEWNAPQYFAQFAAAAGAVGLAFLAEADQAEMEDEFLSADTRRRLDVLTSDRLRREQYRDFIQVRRFRQTLLCRDGLAVAERPRPDRIPGLFVSSSASAPDGALDVGPGIEVTFAGVHHTALDTGFPLAKATLTVLIEAWPARVGYRELAARVAARLGIEATAQDDAELRELLMRLYGVGLV